MARGVIGKLPVVYDPVARRVVVENSAEFAETQIRQKLDELAHGKPLHLILSVDLERKSRTLPQNRMMWALLTIMADHYNGGRTGGITPEDCYTEMLEQYGAAFDYLEVPVGAVPILRKSYRLVHVVELDDIVLKSTQVPIVKDDKGVCRLQTSLKVDRFAYDDAGSITMVQFITGEGKKILWPEA